MAMNYDRNHIFTDGDISRRSLNRSHRTLVKNINEHDIGMILREMKETGLLSSTEIKDITSLHLLSFRTRILLSKIYQKGENGYNQFKSILLILERFYLLQTLIENEMVFEHNQQQKLNVDESQQPNSLSSHSQQMKTIDRSIECKICMETALSMAFIPKLADIHCVIIVVRRF